MTEALGRHRRWTTLGLDLPLVAGGWFAILFGAWDCLPWLTSPAVVGGVGVTGIVGLWLERRGAIRLRQIALAVVLGGVGFGLSLLLVYGVVLLIWLRPGGATVTDDAAGPGSGWQGSAILELPVPWR